MCGLQSRLPRPAFLMTLQDALNLHKSGDLTAAEKAYREILAEKPEDGDSLHLLGVLLQERGNFDEGLDLLRRAIAADPNCAQFHLSLGGALVRSGDMDNARLFFERTLDLDPNNTQAHTVLGYLWLHEGDAAAAENRFKVGRRVEADDPMMLFGLGAVHLSRGEPAHAAKFLAAAADRKPDDAAIQTALGQSLFDQGAFGLAEKAFENAVKLKPDLSIAKLYLARSRMRQDKIDAARDLFAELVADDVQAFSANAGLGDVARKQGHVVKALRFYRRALAINPSAPGAALACAWCTEALGDLRGAAEYLSAGLARSPQADELRPPLAQLLERLGRTDESAKVRAQMTNPSP